MQGGEREGTAGRGKKTSVMIIRQQSSERSQLLECGDLSMRGRGVCRRDGDRFEVADIQTENSLALVIL